MLHILMVANLPHAKIRWHSITDESAKSGLHYFVGRKFSIAFEIFLISMIFKLRVQQIMSI